MNRLLGFFIAAMALVSVPVAVFAQKTVFVVESYHAEFLWDKSYREALEEALGAEYRLEFFEMDTKRVPKDRHRQRADAAWQRYLVLQPDLVVLGDDAALEFLGARFSTTQTPVVYLGVNNNPRKYLPVNTSNFTGVLERPLMRRSVVYIKDLIPAAKKILVLFDANVTSQIVRKEVFQDKDSIDIGGILVEIKLLGTLEAWRETITATEGRYDAVVIGLYQTVVDAEGKPVDAEELIAWVSQHTRIPPFAFWDFAVGADKTIGGLVLYGKDMGILAGELVKKILAEGKRPAELRPIFNDQGVFLFSKAQLAKWKISLPERILRSAALIE